MPSWWYSKSKQGHQWFHLATSISIKHFNVGSQTLLTIIGALGIYLGFRGKKARMKLDMTAFANLQKK